MPCALNLLLMVEDAKYKDFADRLNKSLQEQSIGVKELSEFSGVSYEMARRYTLGTAKPRDEKMIRIADRLAVSLLILITGYPLMAVMRLLPGRLEFSNWMCMRQPVRDISINRSQRLSAR